MNYYMNQIIMTTFSYFDVGSGETGLEETERFYHGFVLGLMAEQAENYVLKSNRESGFGRYDVMMIPKKENLPAVILEFKVHRPKKEKDLEETVQMALQQKAERDRKRNKAKSGVVEIRKDMKSVKGLSTESVMERIRGVQNEKEDRSL